MGPDEPRYIAIGRSMAASGDFITPRLWNSPWFEKPPLLYWMTAAGSLTGLPPEVAGRLPVALLSLLFLWAAFQLLRREFRVQPALLAVGLLATSLGWMAYSNLALTDLPLAVFFSLATFLALALLRAEPELKHLQWRLAAIGAALGCATLAKGLVPLALAVPMMWFLRRSWRSWWAVAAAFLVVAGPWYGAMYTRNGYAFVSEFFIRHHFERLYSASLQHVQPWYYYFPVAALGLLPWTPLFFLGAGVRPLREDRRRLMLAATCGFGFLVFSVSLNKLPGYLLPLFPSAFALLGSRFEGILSLDIRKSWLFPCAVFIAGFPLAVSLIPVFLRAGGLSSAAFHAPDRIEDFYIALPIAVVLLARRSWTVPLLMLCVVAAGVYAKATVYPILDAEVSARGLWRDLRAVSGELCDAGMSRDWILGISFYRNAYLKPCDAGGTQIRLRAVRDERPSIVTGQKKPVNPKRRGLTGTQTPPLLRRLSPTSPTQVPATPYPAIQQPRDT